jgi:4-oxalocrotonate tautomerase
MKTCLHLSAPFEGSTIYRPQNGEKVQQEIEMPFVNIKVTPENLTPEKKRALIAGVTALLQTELNKNPETTIVIIDEVDTDNWGIGGESVTNRRRSASN